MTWCFKVETNCIFLVIRLFESLEFISQFFTKEDLNVKGFNFKSLALEYEDLATSFLLKLSFS